MLPNLTPEAIHIYGPIQIHVFGLLVALAVMVGYFLAKRRAAALELDTRIIVQAMNWAVVVGFVFAHWFDAIFYTPEKIVANPMFLLEFWDGISSFGGFIGGVLGAWLFFRHRNIPMLDYAEPIVSGLVPAWVLGRLGCTLVFDHPGAETTFFLGMQDGNGIVRHNLGLYEMLFALMLSLLLYVLREVRPFRGFTIALVFLLYGLARFGMDWLRIADATYFGLTAGQYLSVLLVIIGFTWLSIGTKLRKVPRLTTGVRRCL